MCCWFLINCCCHYLLRISLLCILCWLVLLVICCWHYELSMFSITHYVWLCLAYDVDCALCVLLCFDHKLGVEFVAFSIVDYVLIIRYAMTIWCLCLCALCVDYVLAILYVYNMCGLCCCFCFVLTMCWLFTMCWVCADYCVDCELCVHYVYWLCVVCIRCWVFVHYALCVGCLLLFLLCAIVVDSVCLVIMCCRFVDYAVLSLFVEYVRMVHDVLTRCVWLFVCTIRCVFNHYALCVD